MDSIIDDILLSIDDNRVDCIDAMDEGGPRGEAVIEDTSAIVFTILVCASAALILPSPFLIYRTAQFFAIYWLQRLKKIKPGSQTNVRTFEFSIIDDSSFQLCIIFSCLVIVSLTSFVNFCTVQYFLTTESALKIPVVFK